MAALTSANYVATEDGGLGDDLFDHIDDLLDFPNDDLLAGFVLPVHCSDSGSNSNQVFTSLPPVTPPVPLPGEDEDQGLFGGSDGDDTGDLLRGGGGGGDEDSNGDNITAVAGPGASGFGNGQEQKFDGLQCEELEELEIISLEWMSQFLEESDAMSLDLPNCKNAINIAKDNNAEKDSFFRTSSPVSVLEHSSPGGGAGGGSFSSSSTSSSSLSFSSAPYFVSNPIKNNSNARASVNPPDPIPQVPGRARSKRLRPASFSARPHATMPFLPPSSDAPAMQHPPYLASSDPESFGEYSPIPMKKKKKKKSAVPAIDGAERGSPPPVRKCMHCEITKTPQWRAGPMGPKTLCNACGVRYKSGRLFPEYRPAASPTFIPSVHSNSHKKVVEMRIKSSQRAAVNVSSESSYRNSCDLLEYIRRR